MLSDHSTISECFIQHNIHDQQKQMNYSIQGSTLPLFMAWFRSDMLKQCNIIKQLVSSLSYFSNKLTIPIIINKNYGLLAYELYSEHLYVRPSNKFIYFHKKTLILQFLYTESVCILIFGLQFKS